MNNMPTIFALASAPGRAGVAVLRISGPQAGPILTQLGVPTQLPEPRLARLRALQSPTTGELIDRALVLWFPAPHSFTGEDVVELHLHGGRAVVQAVTDCLRVMPGVRLAEPGEFSRRAFEHGKLDLTEAEAIADLVDAETAAQRRQALRQMDGALGQLYHGWATQLKRILAHSEADIDFADEDLPPDIMALRLKEVQDLLDALALHLNDHQRGERLRSGFTVAIVGPPNAGKSSLLNALAQREAAIVSPIAGTTRDVIEVQLDLGGYPVTLADTAGLRLSTDAIEAEGIRRAQARAAQADLKLLIYDGASWPALDITTQQLSDAAALTIINKCDLIAPGAMALAPPGTIFVSALSGAGLQELITGLIHAIDLRFTNSGQPSLTRARHRTALEECQRHLQRALLAAEPELRAEDFRLALRALGQITGQVDIEDLLDVIFRDFCIGK